MYNEKQIFIAACLCLTLFGMMAVSVGSVLPELITKFGVGELEAGVVASLLFAGILVGSLFFGPIADTYGFKGLFIVCCGIVLLGLQGLAFGTAWWMIQIAVFAIGVGGGALNGGTSGIVADISDDVERGSRLSILGIFYGVGAIAMPSLLVILSTWFTRETIFMGIGVCILAIMAYLLAISFPSAKQGGGIPVKEMGRLLKDKALLGLGVFLLFQSGMESVVSSWITSFLQAQPDILPKMALMALTVHMIALALMRFLLSRLLKVYPDYSVLLGSYALIVLGCLVLWGSASYSVALLGLVLLGSGFAGGFPIIFAQIGRLWSDVSGTAFSVVLTIALTGGMSLSYLMGVLAHHFSIDKLPLLLIAAAICLGVVIFSIRRTFQRQKKYYK